MNMEEVARGGLVLLGCGKMGSAMLRGWLERGLPPAAVQVIEPNPSEWLKSTGVTINPETLREAPAIMLIAVKPQAMGAALPAIAAMGNGATLFVSVAAGTPIAALEPALGEKSPIIRAMPNTPAAIGKGITAVIGNAHAGAGHLEMAETLLAAVGQVVRLDNEDQMDAVTGLSGSGPAYVFHLIECLAEAGAAEGLPEELAMQLAKATVAGAGALAEAAGESPAQLRVDVTSPGGTTQAGLEVLMDPETGLAPLIAKTVAAATRRSRELRDG